MRWVDRAACQGQEALFFGAENEPRPKRDTRTAKAKAICMLCPVREQCLDYALRNTIRHGIWGGLSYECRTRKRHRRNRGAAAA